MKNILSLLVLFITTSLVSINAQALEWTASGIGGGGGMFSPSISPFNNQEYYITSDMSGIFHSVDSGNLWEILPFYQLTGRDHNTKINFTSNPSVLYSTAYTGYPYPNEPQISTDNGNTWSTLPTDPTYGDVFYLFADPNSTSRLIVSDYSNIYYSSDSGQTFTNIFQTTNQNGIHIAGAFWDNNDIFIGTSLGFICSHDNGNSFVIEDYTDDLPSNYGMMTFTGSKQSSSLVFFCVAKPASDIWGGYHPGDQWSADALVFRLNYNSGTGWENKSSGIPPADYLYHVAMSTNDSNTVYVAGYSIASIALSVYKSTNSGNTWTEVFLTDNNQNINTGWMGYGGDLGWGWAGNVLGLGVSPNNPDVVVITDWGFAHASTNGGDTWQQIYVPANESNAAGSSTPTHLAYHSNGLEITSVWWLTWLDQNNLIASYTDITGLKSNDGGITWSHSLDYPTNYNTTYQVIKHPDNGNIYAMVSSVHDLYESTYLTDGAIDWGTGEIFVSSDNGDTWSSLYNFQHPVVYFAIDPNNTSHFYASVVHSTQGGIFYSADSGITWTMLSAPPRTEGHPFNIHVLNDGTLLCSYSGRISNGSFTLSSGVFTSSNNGQAWDDVSHNDMMRWTRDVIIDPHDTTQNTWYACIYSHWGTYPNEVGGIFRTYNRGISWTRISDLYRVGSLTLNPNNADKAYISTENGLFYSDDFTSANPTYTLINYPFIHPQRVFFNPYDNNEIWATSFGNGLQKAYEIPVSIAEDKHVNNTISICPNPCNKMFTIESDKNITSWAIYDVDGRMIERNNNPLNRYVNTEKFDAGVYLLNVVTKDGKRTAKFIVE